MKIALRVCVYVIYFMAVVGLVSWVFDRLSFDSASDADMEVVSLLDYSAPLDVDVDDFYDLLVFRQDAKKYTFVHSLSPTTSCSICLSSGEWITVEAIDFYFDSADDLVFEYADQMGVGKAK